MAQVQVNNLTKRFGTLTALDDVTLTFPDGQFFGLLGPSGSGKTTLLRAIAGFIFADKGTVRIGDRSVENVPVEKREIGMVFQNYALFPNMSVADNIGFGLRVRKVSAVEEKKRVGEALDLVQLGDLGDRRPHQLSGGQRQRIALARAIVTRPRVLLLDEPLSALDKALRLDMQIELKRIQREVGITTIFVTHDQEEALTLSDSIGILKDGKLVQHGPPRVIYNRPDNEFTAVFLGEANLFRGVPEGGGLRLIDGTLLPPSGNDPLPGVVAVRPENISVSASVPGPETTDLCLEAVLVQRVFAGAMATLVLDWQGQTIKAVARDRDIPDIEGGAKAYISWSPKSTIGLPG
ncbi:MAG: ABC transporter ATP-binding protein [Alphaproteobacteria bacterium]